jgi:hypothetical protein
LRKNWCNYITTICITDFIYISQVLEFSIPGQRGNDGMSGSPGADGRDAVCGDILPDKPPLNRGGGGGGFAGGEAEAGEAGGNFIGVIDRMVGYAFIDSTGGAGCRGGRKGEKNNCICDEGGNEGTSGIPGRNGDAGRSGGKGVDGAVCLIKEGLITPKKKQRNWKEKLLFME